MHQSVGDKPQSEGPFVFGVIQPHVLERSTPKTAIARPDAERTTPTTSR